MDLREALYIVSINKYDGISNAAKQLEIGQSTLSRCLQAIETELGEPIFIRSNGNYTPTYIGSQYLNYAEQMLQLDQDWRGQCQKIKSQDYGTLTITLPIVHSLSIMTDILPKFYARYPHISVELREESKWINLQDIENNKVDIGIFTTNNMPNDLDYETLGRDEIILAAPKGHKIKSESFEISGCTFPCLELEQILNSSFIMLSSDQLTGMYMEDYFLDKHISPSVALTTRSHEVALDMAHSGQGLCFMPRSYASHYIKSKPLDLYHFHKPSKPLALIAAYQKGVNLPEYTKFFMELVRDFTTEITDTWYDI